MKRWLMNASPPIKITGANAGWPLRFPNAPGFTSFGDTAGLETCATIGNRFQHPPNGPMVIRSGIIDHPPFA
jgi:hypothetical protein